MRISGKTGAGCFGGLVDTRTHTNGKQKRLIHNDNMPIYLVAYFVSSLRLRGPCTSRGT